MEEKTLAKTIKAVKPAYLLETASWDLAQFKHMQNGGRNTAKWVEIKSLYFVQKEVGIH